jgi:hypothetical protein
MYNSFTKTLGKIKKTKLSMLVALVILNILTTISLYFMMTNSTLNTIGSDMGESVVTLYGFSLNVSLVFSAIIAVLWLVALILFYEMKTDDELEQNIVSFERYMSDFKAEADAMLSELKDYKDTQIATSPKYAVDMDKIK